jgi:RimJ/RimL family protein N-acetyltransferase
MTDTRAGRPVPSPSSSVPPEPSAGIFAPLKTERLTLRPWRVDDAGAALEVYGHPDVVRWLSPELDRVPDVAAMRLLLQQWVAEDARLAAPAGRWAVQQNSDGRLVGGAVLLPLPPGGEDMEIGCQLRPDVWGNGYAAECTFALAAWAFGHGVDEVFAVVRPGNVRAAKVFRRNGMHWVGETTKYFGLDLQVFRLRAGDLDSRAPEGHQPPKNAEARSVRV